jgi:hypothetical protein
MGYLAMRFEWRYAVSAIIANLHDVVIILGFFAAFQWEFSLPVLAAVLAVLGYSVNESVVVFDRVREVFRNARKRTLTVPEVMDSRDHQHDFAHHHHARFDPDDGAVDAAVRRRSAALLRGGADHRHLFRHLLVSAGRLPAGDVAGRQARTADQAAKAQRGSRGLTRAVATTKNRPWPGFLLSGNARGTDQGCANTCFTRRSGRLRSAQEGGRCSGAFPDWPRIQRMFGVQAKGLCRGLGVIAPCNWAMWLYTASDPACPGLFSMVAAISPAASISCSAARCDTPGSVFSVSAKLISVPQMDSARRTASPM